MQLRLVLEKLRQLFAVLSIIRFSLAVPTILIITLIASDQLTDALIAVADDGVLTVVTIALLITTLFTALIVWYTARTMLRFRFAGNPASDPNVHRSLKRQLPRLLAVSVPAAIFLRVLSLWSALADHTEILDLGISLGVVVVITAVYVFQRRNIAKIPRLGLLADQEAEEARNLTRLMDLPATTLRLLAALIVLNAVVLALAIWGRLFVIGAPALLLLALGLIAVTGSVLVYMGNWYRVPVLTMLLLWAAFWSFFNDNHAVRQSAQGHSHGFLARSVAMPVASSSGSPLASRTLSGYFGEWWTELARLEPGDDSIPVVIVAADGGGIRAAYWTGLVLAALEDQSRGNAVPFSRHVFAISGVSGGSLGAATFAAIAAHRAKPGQLESRTWVQEASDVLSKDYLSPTLANALFPDLLQRFLPLPIFDDRAMALEQSWERGWETAHPTDGKWFSGAFHTLWATGPHSVPLLLLNGTVVETGQRSILSPLTTPPAVDETAFSSVFSVGPLFGTQLPLSTAVLLSARFTYVSPAGLIGPVADTDTSLQWRRIVDGGYFDNSGGVTAQEIIRTIHQVATTRPMRVILIHIRNDPPNARAPLIDWSKVARGRAWLSETFSPVQALLNTRAARATQAVEYLRASGLKGELTFFEPTLYRDRTDLPLGWALSRSVCAEMERQLSTCVANGRTACAADVIPKIINAMYGQSRPTVGGHPGGR